MKYVVVHAGKGGVGKTTIACTLAYMLKEATNKEIGFVDLDISNPNAHYLLKPVSLDVYEDESGEYLLPIPTQYSIKFFSTRITFDESIAINIDDERAEEILDTLLDYVKWDVDYLVVDMPPGSTSLHKELAFRLQVEDNNIILVSTRHPMSVEDLKRSIDFWTSNKLKVDAIIFNMSNLFKYDVKLDYDTLYVDVGFYSVLQNKIKPISELNLVVKKIIS